MHDEDEIIHLEHQHHQHDEREEYEEDHPHLCSIELEADIFKKLKEKAAENRELFNRKGIVAVNIMGSIGSGKTELIFNLSKSINQKHRVGYIAGDVATTVDYDRVKNVVKKGVQINTGKECHLDPIAINKALERILDAGIDVLFMENVGNLICPSDFDLGEEKRVVVVSVDQGPWIIRKHPILVKTCNVIVINKIDLARIMGVSVDDLAKDAETLNPHAKVVATSTRTGQGLKNLMEALDLA